MILASPKAKARMLIALALLLAMMSSLFLAWLCACSVRASPSPSPRLGLDVEDGDDGFPAVDWQYWMSVNPDIVAWVTVPGTNIDSPIVHAQDDDPTWYLRHDVFGEYNPIGCPYLDFECNEDLSSSNSCIFGHHVLTGEAFSDLARMHDAAIAEDARILLQTPNWKKRLSIACVAIIRGSDPTKRVAFESHEDFAAWYQSRWRECALRLSDEPKGATIPDQVFTFVTCSYTTWSNERTVVYACDGRFG